MTLFRKSIYFWVYGDLLKAEELMLKCIEIGEKKSSSDLIDFYASILEIYMDLGNDLKAKQFLEKTLDLIQQPPVSLDDFFYYFVIIQSILKLGDLRSAEELFKKLEGYNTGNIDFLSNFLQFTKASLLKHNTRAQYKLQATDLYKDLIDKEIIIRDISALSIIHLIEIFILEYKMDENPEVLFEINQLAEKLSIIITKNGRLSLLIQKIVLQSKLSLIEGNIKQSIELLDKAHDICQEKELFFLRDRVTKEKNDLMERISKIDNFNIEALTIKERIKLTQIEDYIKKAQKMLG